MLKTLVSQLSYVPNFLMANPDDRKVHRYAAWAVPPEDVSGRIKKLMAGLRAEFGGPEIIEPHIPMVGSILSTHSDVVKRFRQACGTTGPFECEIERVATRKFYYQCVILCIEPQEVDRPMKSFSWHFGRLGNMPHLSLLYGDLTQEEKERAKAKAEVLDDSIVGLRFTINRAVLYKCNEDMTQQSWEKIDECRLR